MSDKSLKKLVDGFNRFRHENYTLNPERMKDLVENGQHPKTLVIACCDSRSCPETLLDTDPGEIFVGRQIAALVPPFDAQDSNDTVAASIEYAVEVLGVEDIVIVGHSSCGGIEGLAKDVDTGAVGQWIQRGREIKERVEKKIGKTAELKKLAPEMERESVVWSLENLRKYPAVDKALKAGTLKIHGWQFDMKNGCLQSYNAKTKKFERLSDAKNTISQQPKKNGKPPQKKRFGR